MNNERQGIRFFHFVPLFIFLLIFNGCGYSIYRHADLPYKEIGIGLIENRTLEPKLQDKLHKALAEEFLRQGIIFSNTAAYRLSAVINNFEMRSLSEKNGITIQYSVLVNADFRLADQTGTIREIKNTRSPFFVSFTGSEDLGSLLAARELAEERALRDIAVEIVGVLIYK